MASHKPFLNRASKGFKELQRASKSYKGLQRASKGFKGRSQASGLKEDVIQTRPPDKGLTARRCGGPKIGLFNLIGISVYVRRCPALLYP